MKISVSKTTQVTFTRDEVKDILVSRALEVVKKEALNLKSKELTIHFIKGDWGVERTNVSKVVLALNEKERGGENG